MGAGHALAGTREYEQSDRNVIQFDAETLHTVLRMRSQNYQCYVPSFSHSDTENGVQPIVINI